VERFLIFFLTLALLLSGCAAPAPTAATPEPKTLMVFAAASLTNAFEELGTAFEAAHPGVTVKFNFGGSQALRTQIEQGAQADVFASANAKEMDLLVTGKFVAPGSPKIFLTNRLVVILPAKNPAGLKNLAGLAGKGVKLVLAAKEVPVGNYSLQTLEKLEKILGPGFKDQVLKNVVSYEGDVKQVVAKVQLGEADAGLVYSSDTVAAAGLQQLEIPAESNVVAQYPLAVLTQTQSPELARAFTAFVLSEDGQSVLQKWGFLPVK
jgi:molybdate transport system substrate-binding protein